MFQRLLPAYLLLLLTVAQPAFSQVQYYTEPTWKPRGILPYEDAITNKFWPPSAPVNENYNDPDFDENRLAKVPNAGVYPRVLITPSDVEKIREKVALGDKAPLAFRAMWERVKREQTPFYALVTQNVVLGKSLAAELIQKVKTLEPKIEALNKRPDKDNLWAVERSIVASGNPDPPTEIWDLLNYDYLHFFMTEEERALTRNAIAKICHKRITNFMAYPDHFMINNHQGFGMEYIRLLLLLEGLPEFDTALYKQAAHKVKSMIDYYLDKDGMCYESIKGWLNISAFVAIGLRERNLLKHSHLRAKMKFFQAAIHWEDDKWMIRDEMRASAFHVIWMMHYYHPQQKDIDFLYQSTFSSHDFLTNPNAKWPNPVGICNELLLLFADEGITDKQGKNIDWNNNNQVQSLQLPTWWHDSLRGYVHVRNSWKKDDLHVSFVCKQDFYYGGHEGSENNRLILWKDGVNWIQDNNMLATKASFLQNMITIDGKGLHWPPAPGNWLGVKNSPIGTVACGDGKIGYSYFKVMQVHPLAFPSAKIPYYAAFAEGNYDLSRDLQIAFQPATIQWNHGYAHTDYGPWSGETRLVESYKPWNVVEKAFRTVHVAKGNYPYVLVIDDLKKDEQKHQYSWNISVPPDVELVDASTPEVVFQNTEPSAVRMNDLIIAKSNINRDAKTGKPILKKGDPLCLIRVLWRNTDYGFPVPRLEKFQAYSLITIPANAVEPEFRVLIYPYKYGDPLPTTTWNASKTMLEVKINQQKDTYTLQTADAGRTVISVKRNNAESISSEAKPAKPNIIIRHQSFNQNDYRYTRKAHSTPEYVFGDSVLVQFEKPVEPAYIVYTLNGSEPQMNSTRFVKPFWVHQNTTIKACTVNPAWIAGNELVSDVLTAKCTKRNFAQGTGITGLTQGIRLRLYEINTKIYNDKGFFDANKKMLPNTDSYQTIVDTLIENFIVPNFTSKAPLEEQVKGFYRYNTSFHALKKGVYRFKVYSCGPVQLLVGNQTAIESAEVFHQHLTNREGEVVLDAGWHRLQLIICDPLFWNSNSLDTMPLQIAYALEGAHYQPVESAQLMTEKKNTPAIHYYQAPVVAFSPQQKVPLLEAGFDLKVYKREGLRRKNTFLDIASNEEPLYTQRTQQLEAAISRNSIKVYDGYFYAPESGIYQFDLPKRNGENALLGGLQASCQNQICINNTPVLQRGVYGRNLLGRVQLTEGWYPISLRYGNGEASCKVVMPDGQTTNLNGYNVFRPSMVQILPKGKVWNQNLFEIFEPIYVQLNYALKENEQIKYTIRKQQKVSDWTVYTQQPIKIDADAILTAAVYKNDQLLTTPAQLTFKKVSQPQDGLLGLVQFNSWDGKKQILATPASYKVWMAPETKLSSEEKNNAIEVQPPLSSMPMVDVNVARSAGVQKPGFKLYDMVMYQNALTIGVWFKSFEKNGKLFGKEGYNAYGKAYKTFSCGLMNGKLVANPGKLSGGEIVPNEWQFVVLTANENEMRLYLNGVEVAKGEGSKDLITDAFDFFTAHHALVKSVVAFNKLLSAEEIQHLYKSSGQ